MGDAVDLRGRSIGLAGGCLWVTAVSGVFAGWSLIAIGSRLTMVLAVTVCAYATALFVFGVGMMREVRRMPRVRGESANRRGMMRKFVLVVAAEVVAFVVVARVCLAIHHWVWIVPLDLMVVGLHFLPLASIFRTPRYYAMGALFCAIPALTMALFPATARIGDALSWLVLPPLGCAVVALTMAGEGLAEVRQMLTASA